MSPAEREKLEADLSAYLDGELTADEAVRMREHLASSDDARRLLEELRDVSNGLTQLPRRRAPDEMTVAMIRHAERQQLLGDAEVSPRFRTLTALTRWTAAAAVIVACVLVGWQALQPVGSTGEQFSAPPATNTMPNEPLIMAARSPEPTSRSDDAITMNESEVTPERLRGVGMADWAKRTQDADGIDDDLALSDAPRDEPVTSDEIPVVAQLQAPESEVHGGIGSYDIARPLVDSCEPAVHVVIEPQTGAEHAAVAAMLATWNQRAAAPVYGRAKPGEPAAVESFGAMATAAEPMNFAYQVPITEIKSRIDTLGQSVGEPRRVRVQMNLDAGSSEILARAAREQHVQPSPLAFMLPMDLRESLVRYLGLPGGDADEVVEQRPNRPFPSIPPPNETPATGAVTSAPAGGDADVEVAAADLQRDRVAEAAEAEAAGREQNAESNQRRGFGGHFATPKRDAGERSKSAQSKPARRANDVRDRHGESLVAADGGARQAGRSATHRELTEPIVIIVEEPSASQPTSTAPAASLADEGTASAQSEPIIEQPSPESLPLSLTRQLLDRVLAGPGFEQAALPAEPNTPGRENVLFRVVLMPPPAPTTAPATAPTTQPE